MQPSYFKNIIIYYIHGRDPKLSLSVPLAGQRSQLNIDISDQWDTAFQHQDNAAPEWPQRSESAAGLLWAAPSAECNSGDVF